MAGPHRYSCWGPSLHISTPAVVVAEPHSQLAWGPTPLTTVPAAVTAEPQQEGTHSAQEDTSEAPGFGDWGDCATGPHKTPT